MNFFTRNPNLKYKKKWGGGGKWVRVGRGGPRLRELFLLYIHI